MNKKIALELKAQAEVVAKRFSRKDTLSYTLCIF